MNHCARLIAYIWIALLTSVVLITNVSATTQPKFTIIPIGSTNPTVEYGSGALVPYIVTNKTKITRTLTFVPSVSGISQVKNRANACRSPFTLAPNQSCVMIVGIVGSKLPQGVTTTPIKVCKTNSATDNNPTPFLCSQTSADHNLTVTVANLAPIITNPPARLTFVINGSEQQLTITNRSPTITAKNIQPILTGTALEGQVTFNAGNCLSVAPGQSCVLRFTPGSNQVPRTFFQIQGTNTESTSASIRIVDPGDVIITASPTSLVLDANSSGSFTVTNQSAITDAIAVDIIRSSALQAAGVTASASSGCASIAPLSSDCVITINSGSTAIQNGEAQIVGNNTSEQPVLVSVNAPASPQIAISSPSPANLAFPLGSATSQFVTITNTSTTTVSNITTNISDTDLVGTVSVYTGDCIGPLSPNDSCQLEFSMTASPTTVIPPTLVNIYGDGTNVVTAQVAVGNSYAYLSTSTTGLMYCSIDPYTYQLSNCTTSPVVGSYPRGLAVDNVSHYLYVSNEEPTSSTSFIYRCNINQTDGSLSSCISSAAYVPYTKYAYGLALTPDFERLYVSNTGEGAPLPIYLCDVANFSSCSSSNITAGSTTLLDLNYGLRVAPDGANLYVVGSSSAFATTNKCLIDGSGNLTCTTTATTAPPLYTLSDVAVNPSNTIAYASGRIDSSIYMGAITSGVIAPWTLAGTTFNNVNAHGLAINSQNTYVYVTTSTSPISLCAIVGNALTCANSGSNIPSANYPIFFIALWEPLMF